ncbi:DUF2189 domain-containing protein [Thiomicrospira sp. WB1]|uniref:DUF2189 domain-containing protein n=1 Tax=Thiomicrospira sp. WB1 TaxID=1685380 RepID=UPI000748D1A8|nr:DUF2189 domain-containing protein [Thiomicrospira sp. WB1]KUJ72687.1 hypothetical protein AVO41_02495 [Thiomicrospira sp. WB1]
MEHAISRSSIHHHVTENGEHLVSKDRQMRDIGHWLKQGWMDMANAPLASLFYGLIMTLAVMLVYGAYQAEPIMIFKTATFFVMLSPFLATGLYAISQQMQQGKKPDLWQSMTVWRHNTANFVLYALSLGVIVLVSVNFLPMITAVAQSDNLMIVETGEGIMGFISSQAGWAFMAYFALLVLIAAAFAFAISVVTIPLMLKDPKVSAISAMILSYQVVMENKAVMTAWAITIGAMVILGLVTVGLLMVVIMPLLGYASWHAFNDLIEFEDQAE